jgi:hypothetical protein
MLVDFPVYSKYSRKVENGQLSGIFLGELNEIVIGFFLAKSPHMRHDHMNMIQSPRALGRILSGWMTLVIFAFNDVMNVIFCIVSVRRVS